MCACSRLKECLPLKKMGAGLGSLVADSVPVAAWQLLTLQVRHAVAEYDACHNAMSLGQRCSRCNHPLGSST